MAIDFAVPSASTSPAYRAGNGGGRLRPTARQTRARIVRGLALVVGLGLAGLGLGRALIARHDRALVALQMSLSAQLNVERAALDAQRLAFKSLPVKPSVTPPLPPAPVSRPDQPMPPAQAHISPPVAPSLTGVVIAPTPVARVVTPAVALAITRATSVVAPVSGPKSVASGRVAVAPVEAAEKADKQRVVKARPLLAPTAKPVTREAVSATAEGEIETRHDPANANANAPARARDRAPTPPTAATVARVPQPTRDADSSHVEAVSQRQAQVADLSRGAVRMQSGLTISVGAKFPSGETLLRVDPAKHQIVTNLRTIVLMPSD